MTRTVFVSVLAFAGCSSDKTIAVRNTPPAATITSPTDGKVYAAGEVIEFKGLVKDSQTPNEELVVTWDTDQDGLLTDESLADVDGYTQFSTAALTPGLVHTVTLRVVDGGGKSASDTVAITVGEGSNDIRQEPKVTILAPHPSGSDSPWDEGELFPFEAQVEDLQDSPSIVTVHVDIIDDEDELIRRICTTLPFISSAEDTVGYAFCEASVDPGNHTILFSAIDSEGNVGEARGSLRVQSSDEIDNDGDGYTEEDGDCDDTDEDVHPDAFEYENGEDDDCDGDIDEGTDSFDDDGDGYTENVGDCDDDDPDVHPFAIEVCDGIDNDCSGEIDDDVVDGARYYADLDGDGYGSILSAIEACDMPDGYVLDSSDCNDTDGDSYPGGEEVCDGSDNNCDGFVDEEGASGCTTWYQDLDDDGYGSTVSICACAASGDFTSSLSSDCYDLSATANPTHTSFHTSNRGDGSYDYNCDYVEEKQTTTESGTCAFFSGFCAVSDGWASSPPSCGSSGTWRTGCYYSTSGWPSEWGCYWASEYPQTQACR